MGNGFKKYHIAQIQFKIRYDLQICKEKEQNNGSVSIENLKKKGEDWVSVVMILTIKGNIQQFNLLNCRI